MDLLAYFQEQSEMLKRLPPKPRAVLMNHKVPVGGAYRQWDTRGDLYIWVNPSIMDAMVYRRRSVEASLFGIDIILVP